MRSILGPKASITTNLPIGQNTYLGKLKALAVASKAKASSTRKHLLLRAMADVKGMAFSDRRDISSEYVSISRALAS